MVAKRPKLTAFCHTQDNMLERSTSFQLQQIPALRSMYVPFQSALDARPLIVLAAVIAIAPANSNQDSTGQSTLAFSEISASVGLNFKHNSGVVGSYEFPEIMGSGAAVLDYDNDGLLDIYLINGSDLHKSSSASTNRLFKQLRSGQFIDRTEKAGLGDKGYGMGVAIGDADNDGDLDIYITNLNQDRFFRNLGDGRFQDVTTESGIAVDDWSTSATFCDVNSDGLLDLYVGTYVVNDPSRECRTATGEIDYCAPNIFSAVADRLFLNQGEFKFQERSMGGSDAPKKNRALGVICADFNDDTYPDVFVANDGERNFLWLNDGNGKFVEEGIGMGVAVNMFGESEASMGVDIADLNDDGRMDIYVTHLDGETDTVYLSEGNLFLDSTAELGLALPTFKDSAFGTAFADFDHDGNLDLLVVNGNVRKSKPKNSVTWSGMPPILAEYHMHYAGTNRLFLGSENGKFLEIDNKDYGIEDSSRVSRGLIAADIDGDGDLDALVTNSNSSVQLYRNDVANSRHWVAFRALDPSTKRDALGAVVEVDLGSRRVRRPVVHTRGYLSSQDATVHFGLGNIAVIDGVRVHWHDGTVEDFGSLASNQVHTLEKTTSRSEN